MTKNNFDNRGWGPKLRRKYTNVLFCVTNLFLPLFLSRIVVPDVSALVIKRRAERDNTMIIHRTKVLGQDGPYFMKIFKD